MVMLLASVPYKIVVIQEVERYTRDDWWYEMLSVGPKGQIVIAKEIRDRLGIGPGWISLQCLVDDHVEIRFLPPPHRESLKASLAPYTTISVAPGADWERARDKAWGEAVDENPSASGDA